MRRYTIFIIIAWCLGAFPLKAQTSDSDRLGMALEYFQTGKYHECMLLLERLDKQYELNPRFRAYLGVCYYYEWQYDKAAKYLDAMIPELTAFAPHERSVYYWCCAESHFMLKQYRAAIPRYEQMLGVCFDNEKPDALYRLGFCYMYLSDWQNAYDYFNSALAYFQRYPNEERTSRIAQTKNMIFGIRQHLPKPDTLVVAKDSIRTSKRQVKPVSITDTVKLQPVKDINMDKIYQKGIDMNNSDIKANKKLLNR